MAATPVTKRPIRSVLIANRGEVAVRVASTLKHMGLRSIVVHTNADRGAPFTQYGDTVVCIGDDRNYINIPVIVAAAKSAGADAIHPGYGFLAESAPFAQAVAEAGIIFIGPSASTIAQLGSKIGAKKLLGEKAPQVPLIPGYYPKEVKPTDEEWLAKANGIGYPVLIKAAAGGGGKGMRVVRDAKDFLHSLDSARTEAKSAFGDDAVMLEKYFECVRHIEVQMLGDSYGAVDHLGERECSVQRRHQKLLEESPSPALSQRTREKIWAAAVAVGKSVSYQGAGTVEFIVEAAPIDADPKFYFLEVNTRLQVEHAVSEECRGVDIVKMQILIASGLSLADAAAAASRRMLASKSAATPAPGEGACSFLKASGYSIEARVYAEDDAFMPCVGTVTGWQPAVQGGRGAQPQHDQLDTVAPLPSNGGLLYHCATDVGSKLGVSYDGLICKVIVHAEESREAARLKLLTALKQLVCFGVHTNRRALINLLAHPKIAAGDCTTDMIDTNAITITDLVKPLPTQLNYAAELKLNKAVDNSSQLYQTHLFARAARIAEVALRNEAAAQRPAGAWSAVPTGWTNNRFSKVANQSKTFIPLPWGSISAPNVKLTVQRTPPSPGVASAGPWTTVISAALAGGGGNGDGPQLLEKDIVLKSELELTHMTGLLYRCSTPPVAAAGGTGAAEVENECLVSIQIDRCPSSMQSQIAMLAPPTSPAQIVAVCHVHFMECGNAVSFGLFHRLSGEAVTRPASGDDDALPSSFSAGASKGSGGPGEVRSPIPAKVVKVLTSNGTLVKKGDVVVVLESMKMERKIAAPMDGTVHVQLAPGDLVQAGSPIFEVK